MYILLTLLVVLYYTSLDAPKLFLFFMFMCFSLVPTVKSTPTQSSQNISLSICVELPLSEPLII